MSGRSEVPLGVPAASPHSLPSGGSSSGTWGPRIADKDMDWVIRELYPQRGLRIEGLYFWFFYYCLVGMPGR